MIKFIFGRINTNITTGCITTGQLSIALASYVNISGNVTGGLSITNNISLTDVPISISDDD